MDGFAQALALGPGAVGGGGGSPRLLCLRVVVLTLTLVEEKDTPALPSGLASQFVPVARQSLPRNQRGAKWA